MDFIEDFYLLKFTITRISGPSGFFEILAPAGVWLASLTIMLSYQQWGNKRTHEQGGRRDTRTAGTNGHTNRGDEWTHENFLQKVLGYRQTDRHFSFL